MFLTQQLLQRRFGNDVSAIVIQYFQSSIRTWKRIARAGEYEACMQCPPDFIDEAFLGACRGGFLTLAQSLLLRGAMECDKGLFNAARAGDFQLVDFLLPFASYGFALKGACRGAQRFLFLHITSIVQEKIRYENYYYEACVSGDQDMIAILDCNIHEMGASFQAARDGFVGACYGGHIDLAHTMYLRAQNYLDDPNLADRGLRKACRGGHIEMVRFLLDQFHPYFQFCLVKACQSRNMELVNLLLCMTSSALDFGLYGACLGGDERIVNRLLEAGATDYSWAMRGACRGGHIEIAKRMMQLGGKDMRNCFFNAAMKNRRSMVSFLMDCAKENNLQDLLTVGLEGACRTGHANMVLIMIEHGATTCTVCKRSIQDHVHSIQTKRNNIFNAIKN